MIDVAIVGAGAAGLATAIFTRRARPQARVVLFEGARLPGAKILVSGGSRCNVTNTVVTEADFNGGRPGIIRRVLRSLPVDETVAFFQEIGVPLHEERGGKLFPDSNRSRDVVQALLREVARAGVELRSGCRVADVTRKADGFDIRTPGAASAARAVVLTTGGLSLPKTGSDGWGYGVARRLGHTIVPTTPALVPLVLERDNGGAADGEPAEARDPRDVHRLLSGVALPAAIALRIDGVRARRITGSLLCTHFGISGPAALDASRHWLRARLEGRPVDVTASLAPEETFDTLDARWTSLARTRPRLALVNAVADLVPASVAAVALPRAGIPVDRTLAELTRTERRALIHTLLTWPLAVRDSRGYNYAEVTAGGVPLAEIDPATMASRLCPGLFLAGEILDVDGRLGGFNFQWAWASAKTAAHGLSRV